MSKQQYFYIISGLPGISLQDEHLPFSAKFFLDDLANRIDKKDFELVRMLYYPRDNRNLLDILFNRSGIIQPEGCYSLQELEKGEAGNIMLPHFMIDFIASYKENKNRHTESGWETKLTEAYYQEAMNSTNIFLRDWMEFELNLKNLLLVISNRKHTLPFTEIVIDANEMADELIQNSSADISMEPTIDFLNQAIKILETENFIEREMKIDELKWKKLEEMAFFHYFTVEAILSYCIKLMIIERWVKLIPGRGKEFIPSILNSIIDKVKIPIAENS